MPRFKVTDNSLNSYGFRVLTEGIDFSLFDQNPIMLFMHNRYWGNGDPLPPGKWKDREMNGDVVTMEPVFDEEDKFALSLKSKVDKGILNMASIGIDEIETSSDPKYMLPGQTRPTITKCVLKEVSLVDIGSNRNAVKIYHKGVEVKLTDGLYNEFLPLINNNKPKNMKSIALKLTLAEGATEDQILAKITEIQSENGSLRASNAGLQEKVDGYVNERATALVDKAITEKRITADKKETFLKLAKTDFENCSQVLAAMQPQKKPTEVINQGNNSDGDDGQTWEKLVAKGEEAVLQLRSEDPVEYAKLYKAHYGIEPKIK